MSRLHQFGRAKTRRVPMFASALAGMLLLAACGGNAEGDTDQVSGEGFAYGADQSEVNEVIADLEPVTLSYQSPASSEDHVLAQSTIQFRDYVEERSNGQISLDITWGTAVAGYGEVDDALLDGRLDLAYTLPVYDTSSYPMYDALSSLSVYAPSTPFAGEAASYAMMSTLAWENEDVLDEFESKGLRVLSPMINTGQYGTWCSEPSDDLSAFDGSTISISTAANSEIIQSLGGTPVNLEWLETYEALERNTVRCTMINQPVSASSGVTEVAPHMVFAQSGSPSKASGSHVAGSSFEELPLAYQQIIFDSEVVAFDGWLQHIENAIVANAESGAEFIPFNDEAQAAVDEAHEKVVQQHIENGTITEEHVERAKELADIWSDHATELGFEDEGTLGDFDEWYNPEEVDFEPLGEKLMTETFLDHRPGA